MAISMKEYARDKKAFYQRHTRLDGKYQEFGEVTGEKVSKQVCFPDGASWWEVTEPYSEKVTIIRHGLKIPIELKYIRTEVWDSEDSKSRFLYQHA